MSSIGKCAQALGSFRRFFCSRRFWLAYSKRRDPIRSFLTVPSELLQYQPMRTRNQELYQDSFEYIVDLLLETGFNLAFHLLSDLANLAELLLDGVIHCTKYAASIASTERHQSNERGSRNLCAEEPYASISPTKQKPLAGPAESDRHFFVCTRE